MQTLPLFDYYFNNFIKDIRKNYYEFPSIIYRIYNQEVNLFYHKDGSEVSNKDFNEICKEYVSKKKRQKLTKIFIKDEDDNLIQLKKPIICDNLSYRSLMNVFKNLENTFTNLIITNIKVRKNLHDLSFITDRIKTLKYINYFSSSIDLLTLNVDYCNLNNLPNKMRMLNLTNKHFDENKHKITSCKIIYKIKKLPKNLILILKQDRDFKIKVNIPSYKITNISKSIRCVFYFNQNDQYNTLFGNYDLSNKYRKECLINEDSYLIL